MLDRNTGNTILLRTFIGLGYKTYVSSSHHDWHTIFARERDWPFDEAFRHPLQCQELQDQNSLNPVSPQADAGLCFGLGSWGLH